MNPKTTPKDFFLWAGAMITLYGSAIAFINLIFDYINYAFPNVLIPYYYSDPYQGSMSFEIATLIVLFPAFLALMRVIRKDIAKDASRGEVWVRRWALYLTLFIAGLTILGDLITLVYTFLSGSDITLRFLLKVAIVLLVAAGGFMHFMADLWGYWAQFPQKARMVGWAVGALIVASIVAGFFIIGTPWQARQYRLDDQRVQDLQSLQSQILSFYQTKQALPASLSQLEDPTLYYNVPVDPVSGQPYEYIKDAELGFQLCATFAAPTRSRIVGGRSVSMPADYGVKGSGDNWEHAAGRTCFTRSIDPDFFPPFATPVPKPAL
jgi:hypothetical protein